MKYIKLVFLILIAQVLTANVEQCVSYELKLDRTDIRAGETAAMTVDINIQKGFHIYSVHPEMSLFPTDVEFADSSFFTAIGIFEEPASHIKYDASLGMTIGSHYGAFSITRELILNPDLDPGEYLLEGTLTFQACDETRCIPKWEDFGIPLNITAGSPRTEFMQAVVTEYPSAVPEKQPESGQSEESAGVLDEAREKGFLSFILLAISMGLLSLLTPCVFPMIPITVSFFTRQGETEGTSPVRSAFLYSLGIVVIYTAVGMLLSVTLGATGANQIASSPWVNLFIAALFIVFTLSLFGMFELQLPSGLRQFSVKQEQKGGILGILFMSFTFVITSFTCTVQFVGLLLVAASRGDMVWPLVGMIAYSSSFALPFFFLALFPQYMGKLPKSGGWLNSVKVIMGFVILAAAMKFLGNVSALWGWGVFSRQMVLSIWVVISFLMGFYLLGKIRLPHDSPVDYIGVPRFIMSIIVLAFAVYLSAGLTGRPLHGTINSYLPHEKSVSDAATAAAHGETLEWIDNLEDGFEAARTKNKPIFVDFTGYTCTNCRWMESNIFVDPQVQALFSEFVLVQLYTDMGDNAKENQNLKVDRFDTAALPFYVILNAEDEVLATFPGLDKNVNHFIEFLKKGLDWHKAG